MKEHAIYIVIGECGEYSDQTNWPVCWRMTLEEAQEVVRVCIEQAQQHTALYREDYQTAHEYRETMFDQCFEHYGADTRYFVWKVSDVPNLKRSVDGKYNYAPYVVEMPT